MSRLKLSEFLNTADEVHALVIGWCEALCPWPPALKAMTRKRAREISKEYHYYMLGRGLGILSWLGIAVAIKEIFFCPVCY